MTPTSPTAAARVAVPPWALWALTAVFAVSALLLVVGLVTGAIRATPGRIRKSGGRAAMTFDATFAPRDRRDALEYLLDDQHRVVVEQEEGDGGGDEDAPPVLFEYPSEVDGGPSATD